MPIPYCRPTQAGLNGLLFFFKQFLNSEFSVRDITLPTKVHIVKAMVFPVVTHGCESWTVRKAECWIIGAFKLWCWWRLLRVPWTARRSNRLTLKAINLEYSLKGPELRPGTPILWPPDANSWLIGKDIDPGKDWGQEEKGVTEDEMIVWHHWLNGHEFEQTMGDTVGKRSLVCCKD